MRGWRRWRLRAARRRRRCALRCQVQRPLRRLLRLLRAARLLLLRSRHDTWQRDLVDVRNAELRREWVVRANDGVECRSAAHSCGACLRRMPPQRLPVIDATCRMPLTGDDSRRLSCDIRGWLLTSWLCVACCGRERPHLAGSAAGQHAGYL